MILNIDSISQLQNKKIALVGYGIEGKATEKYLKSFDINLDITPLDQAISPSYLDKIEDFDLAIVSAGHKREGITIPYTTATNLFFAFCKGTIIGVTGSKGKSTTTWMIFLALRILGPHVHCANITNTGSEQLASPMLISLLESKNDTKDIFVVELSSYQLSDLKYSPQIAVLTSLFPEHLDWHLGIENYQNAKKNIIRYAKSSNYFYFPKSISEKIRHDWLKDYKGNAMEVSNNSSLNLKSSLLRGPYSTSVKIAQEIASLYKLTNEQISKGINEFKTLPHRLEYIGNFKGIDFVDDGASTAPEATILALKTFPNTTTLLLGGEDRGYDYNALAKNIFDSNVRNIALFPNTSSKIKSALKQNGDINTLNLLETESMEEAINFAFSFTPIQTTCTLSTAAPSYSIWKNWEEKCREYLHFIKLLGYSS